MKFSVVAGAEHAFAVGILEEKPKLEKLVDLTLLNQLLKERGKAEITQ